MDAKTTFDGREQEFDQDRNWRGAAARVDATSDEEAINRQIADERDAYGLAAVLCAMRQAHIEAPNGSIMARLRMICAELSAIAYKVDGNVEPVGFSAVERTAETERMMKLLEKLAAQARGQAAKTGG